MLFFIQETQELDRCEVLPLFWLKASTGLMVVTAGFKSLFLVTGLQKAANTCKNRKTHAELEGCEVGWASVSFVWFVVCVVVFLEAE